MLFNKLLLLFFSYTIVKSEAAKRDRSFLENVPHIQWQESSLLSPPAPQSVPNPPAFPTDSEPSPARAPSSHSPSSNRAPPGRRNSDELDEFENLQKRLSRISSIKSTNETVLKISAPKANNTLNTTRLTQIKSDLNKFETRLRNLNQQETSEIHDKNSSKNSSTSSLVEALEEIFNSNNKGVSKKSKNANDVTIVPLPSNELPDWYVTPPPLPILVDGKLVAPEVVDESPLVTDFAPAGKRLPLFEPVIKRTDSELTNVAFDQAGDNRFKWLIPYQPNSQLPRTPTQQFFNNGEFPLTSLNLRKRR